MDNFKAPGLCSSLCDESVSSWSYLFFTGISPGIKLKIFLQPVKMHGVGFWAELIWITSIFNPENSLSGLDEREKFLTFVVLKTLFVECPVKARGWLVYAGRAVSKMLFAATLPALKRKVARRSDLKRSKRKQVMCCSGLPGVFLQLLLLFSFLNNCRRGSCAEFADLFFRRSVLQIFFYLGGNVHRNNSVGKLNTVFAKSFLYTAIDFLAQNELISWVGW